METKKIIWMLKKDLLSLWRHKPRLISLLIFPILTITLFGYGMGGSIENVPIVIVEQSQGNITDQTLLAIKDMPLFEVKNVTKNVNLAKEMVNNGDVKAAIILPSNYEDINSYQSKSVMLYLDSSDQIAGQAIIPATETFFKQIGSKIGAEKLANLEISNSVNTSANLNLSNIPSSMDGILNSINLQVNRIYGNIDYIDFLVPAVLSMTVMMSCMMGMGESIAGERERGELSRLFMTPTSVSTVVGGKIISKLIIEMGRVVILLIVAFILFGVTVKGNILLAILLLMLGVLCFVGFGILISARAGSQEDYTQMVMPFTMPMIFISGVFYPLETMPWIFQKIAYLIPLTYLNDAMREIMLKGGGINDIWIDIIVLLGFLVLFFGLGVTKFNRDI